RVGLPARFPAVSSRPRDPVEAILFLADQTSTDGHRPPPPPPEAASRRAGDCRCLRGRRRFRYREGAPAEIARARRGAARRRRAAGDGTRRARGGRSGGESGSQEGSDGLAAEDHAQPRHRSPEQIVRRRPSGWAGADRTAQGSRAVTNQERHSHSFHRLRE
ncbi:MAG: hypothetical protein BJ554DRAFT_4975, partial [Olpidium bornovanus]